MVTDTFFGGLSNFLQLYNIVLTGRILLSWFPNIARQPVFEPVRAMPRHVMLSPCHLRRKTRVPHPPSSQTAKPPLPFDRQNTTRHEQLFVVTNPFFSIFRGLIPPIGGIDLSPLPAFFLLSFVTNATQSLGAELPGSDASKRPGGAGGGVFPLCGGVGVWVDAWEQHRPRHPSIL